MACVVLRDRWATYAHRIYGEANTDAIRNAAGYLAHSVAVCDDGETVRVGLCATDDAGLARLRGDVPYFDGGVEWLYSVTAGELPGSGE